MFLSQDNSLDPDELTLSTGAQGFVHGAEKYFMTVGSFSVHFLARLPTFETAANKLPPRQNRVDSSQQLPLSVCLMTRFFKGA